MMKLYTLRIGHEMVVYDDTTKDRVERSVRARAARTGDAIRYGDGTSVWYAWEVIYKVPEPGEPASAGWYWNNAGDKVLCQRIRYTKDAAGAVERKVLNADWRPLDD